MIERVNSVCFDVSCDTCSFIDVIDAEEFSEVVAKIKSDGWRISKDGNEWTHTCPSCAEGER